MSIRILTIEDDQRIRTAVRFALEDEGWSVLEAETGEHALEYFKSTVPDVVLVDIGLPGVDGFEVCRALRRTSDVPIIMVTARDDTHDVVAGLEAGADDYVTKPIAPRNCQLAFARFCAGSGPRIRPPRPARSVISTSFLTKA